MTSAGVPMDEAAAVLAAVAAYAAAMGRTPAIADLPTELDALLASAAALRAITS